MRCGDFFIADVLAVERFGGGKRKPRNNDAPKIKHEAVGIGHDRHVTAVAAGGAKKTDDLVFPRAPGKFNHVLRRGGDIVIVNRRGNEDSVSSFNRAGQFFRARHPVTFVRVAKRKIHFANVDPLAIGFLFLQMRERGSPHPAAITVGIATGADYKMLVHWFAGES